MKFKVSAMGCAVPAQQLTSDEIDHRLGLPQGTTAARVGVISRHVSTSETAASLAAQAVQAALAKTHITDQDVDVLIAANATPDQALPFNAALLHRELKWSANVRCVDIGASCLSFLPALEHAVTLIHAGRAKRIVIACSDIATFGLDWTHVEASAIFGDGAAACVVESSADPSDTTWLSDTWLTLSTYADACQIPAGGSRHHPARVQGDFLALTRFQMDGAAVFRAIRKVLRPQLDAVIDRAGIKWSDIACVVPHQASALAIEHLARTLPIESERILKVYQHLGNQVAASLPTALCKSVEQGRLKSGDHVLLVGTGAGLTLGAVVLKW